MSHCRTQLPIILYIKKVYLKIFLTAFFASVFPYLICKDYEFNNIMSLGGIIIASALLTIICIFCLGLEKTERTVIINKLNSLLHKM